jgi:glutaminase
MAGVPRTSTVDAKQEWPITLEPPTAVLEMDIAKVLVEVLMPQPKVSDAIWSQIGDIHRRHSLMEQDDGGTFHPPEMAAERNRFGMAFTFPDGETFYAGDHDYAYPMQSICKVFTYGLALEEHGRQDTMKHVGVAPSSDAFYSYTFDERNRRPFNPMVNAGALVIIDILKGDRDEKVERILERLRVFAGNQELYVDKDVLEAEIEEFSDRNKGLCYLMRSLGMLHGEVEATMHAYLSACSVRVTTRDLANMGATLAHGGVNPVTGIRALEQRYVRDVVTVMSTCGMYDAAGEWAYDVGIPAKSSVSGAILLTMPQRFGGAIFSPALDVYGNSIRGIAVCRELSETFGLHVFADKAEDRLGR